MTIKEGYDVFMRSRNNERYRAWLAIFMRYVQDMGQDPETVDLNMITLQDLYRFLDWMRIRGYSRSSIRVYQTALKSMFDHLQDCGQMQDLDLRCYNLIEVPVSEREYLSLDEIELIDDSFDMVDILGLRDCCVFHLMLDMGYSAERICRLSLRDVDLELGLIHNRMIPDRLLRDLQLYNILVKRRCDRFLVNRSGMALDYEVIKKIFQRIKKRTGIDRLTPTLVQECCGIRRVS